MLAATIPNESLVEMQMVPYRDGLLPMSRVVSSNRVSGLSQEMPIGCAGWAIQFADLMRSRLILSIESSRFFEIDAKALSVSLQHAKKIRAIYQRQGLILCEFVCVGPV